MRSNTISDKFYFLIYHISFKIVRFLVAINKHPLKLIILRDGKDLGYRAGFIDKELTKEYKHSLACVIFEISSTQEIKFQE